MAVLPMPRELRDHIWNELMPWNTRSSVIPVMQTCRQVHLELTDMLYNFRNWTLVLEPSSLRDQDPDSPDCCKSDFDGTMTHPTLGSYTAHFHLPFYQWKWWKRASWKCLQHLPLQDLAEVQVMLASVFQGSPKPLSDVYHSWLQSYNFYESTRALVYLIEECVLQARQTSAQTGREKQPQISVVVGPDIWGPELSYDLIPGYLKDLLALFSRLDSPLVIQSPDWVDEIIFDITAPPVKIHANNVKRSIRRHPEHVPEGLCTSACICKLGTKSDRAAANVRAECSLQRRACLKMQAHRYLHWDREYEKTLLSTCRESSGQIYRDFGNNKAYGVMDIAYQWVLMRLIHHELVRQYNVDPKRLCYGTPDGVFVEGWLSHATTKFGVRVTSSGMSWCRDDKRIVSKLGRHATAEEALDDSEAGAACVEIEEVMYRHTHEEVLRMVHWIKPAFPECSREKLFARRLQFSLSTPLRTIQTSPPLRKTPAATRYYLQRD